MQEQPSPAMEEKRPSLTALASAFLRAHHSQYDPVPRIFDDSLARQMFGDTLYAYLEHNLAQSLSFFDPQAAAQHPDDRTAIGLWARVHTGSIILARARYTEETLERLLEEGVDQYVLLGAGLDTFAFRRPDLVQHLQVFEVDMPPTQGMKRQRLSELGWRLPDRLHFVPLDFASQDLMAALTGARYDPVKRTLWSWLGVTYYLSREVIDATLRLIAQSSAPGSTVIFDYVEAAGFDPATAAPRVRKMIEIVRNAGEPMQTGFVPASLAADLAALGLRLVEDLGPEDLQRLYFKDRTDGYSAFPQMHLAQAVVP